MLGMPHNNEEEVCHLVLQIVENKGLISATRLAVASEGCKGIKNTGTIQDRVSL